MANFISDGLNGINSVQQGVANWAQGNQLGQPSTQPPAPVTVQPIGSTGGGYRPPPLPTTTPDSTGGLAEAFGNLSSGGANQSTYNGPAHVPGMWTPGNPNGYGGYNQGGQQAMAMGYGGNQAMGSGSAIQPMGGMPGAAPVGPGQPQQAQGVEQLEAIRQALVGNGGF